MFATGEAQAQCSGAIGLNGGQVLFSEASASAATTLSSVFTNMDTAFLSQGNAFVSSPKSDRPDFAVGGIWIRGIGGEVETSSTGTATSPVAGFSGTVTCNTTVREGYGGVQVGQDLGELNFGGTAANLHFGWTAGYAEANAHDVNGLGTSGNFQAPFAGVYGVFTYGNFFADALARVNFYEMRLSDSLAGANNQGLDARGVSFGASIGYNIPLYLNWFLEPSLGIIHSNTTIDSLSVYEVIPPSARTIGICGSSTAACLIAGVINFDDVESTLGHAGVRVGTNLTIGQLALQPFVTAAVWNEFEGPTTTTFVNGTPSLAGTVSTTRVGTYGQYSAGAAAQILDTGWLGYLRVDYREGEFINGVGLNGGLRYQFNPTEEVASLPAKAPVVKAQSPPPYNWTGLYVGGIAGAQLGATNWLFQSPSPTIFGSTVSAGTQSSPSIAGFLAGGEAGFNFQFGSWIFGLEGDGAWTNAHGAQGCLSLFSLAPNTFTCSDNIDTLATGTARFGFAWDRTLFYLKGGGAWTREDYAVTCNISPNCFVLSPFTVSDQRLGWTVGAGVEFGLSSNWSVKAEYGYLDFGARTLTDSAGDVFQVKENISQIKIGVNYRWFPGTVVANY
jgi:opacity protein-like surface antigen